MSQSSGHLSLSLRLLGNEIVGVAIDVDDFRTKWAVIAAVFLFAGIQAIPTIQEFLK